MTIVVDCRRVVLSSTNKGAIKRRIQEHEMLDGGYRFHLVSRHLGKCWLTSGNAEGTPFVEGAVKAGNLKCPSIIFYQTPSRILMMAYVYGSHLEKCLESRIDSPNSELVKHSIASMAKTGGCIVSVSDAISKEEILTVYEKADSFEFKPLSIEQIEKNKKIQLKSGVEHSAPATLQSTFLIIGMFVAFSLFGLYLAQGEQKKHDKKIETNSYAEVRSALEVRGAVKGTTWQLYRDLLFIRKLDGWKVTAININKDTALIAAEKMDTGRIDELVLLANETGRSVVSYDSKKATILSQYKPTPTLSDAVTPPLMDLKLYISMSVDDWAGDPNTIVQFGKVQQKKGFSTLPMEWNVDNYLEDDFDLLGTLLHMIPVVFDKATLRLSDNGTVSGKMFFSVYGCERINIINDGTACK